MKRHKSIKALQQSQAAVQATVTKITARLDMGQ